jgi:hypothetical protein
MNDSRQVHAKSVDDERADRYLEEEGSRHTQSIVIGVALAATILLFLLLSLSGPSSTNQLVGQSIQWPESSLPN